MNENTQIKWRVCARSVILHRGEGKFPVVEEIDIPPHEELNERHYENVSARRKKRFQPKSTVEEIIECEKQAPKAGKIWKLVRSTIHKIKNFK